MATRSSDDYFWLRDKGTPEVEALPAGRARLRGRGHEADGGAAAEALRRDARRASSRRTSNVPVPRARLLLLLAHGGGEAVPDLLPQEGLAGGARRRSCSTSTCSPRASSSCPWATMTVSPDGNLLAYTADKTGFRQYTLHVKDLRTGELGPEAIAERVTSLRVGRGRPDPLLRHRAPADEAPLPGSSGTRSAAASGRPRLRGEGRALQRLASGSRATASTSSSRPQPHDDRGALPARRHRTAELQRDRRARSPTTSTTSTTATGTF